MGPPLPLTMALYLPENKEFPVRLATCRQKSARSNIPPKTAPVYTSFDKMVGVKRFELPTSCSQSRRATRLRYTPTVAYIAGIFRIEKPLDHIAFILRKDFQNLFDFGEANRGSKPDAA